MTRNMEDAIRMLLELDGGRHAAFMTPHHAVQGVKSDAATTVDSTESGSVSSFSGREGDGDGHWHRSPGAGSSETEFSEFDAAAAVQAASKGLPLLQHLPVHATGRWPLDAAATGPAQFSGHQMSMGNAMDVSMVKATQGAIGMDALLGLAGYNTTASTMANAHFSATQQPNVDHLKMQSLHNANAELERELFKILQASPPPAAQQQQQHQHQQQQQQAAAMLQVQVQQQQQAAAQLAAAKASLLHHSGMAAPFAAAGAPAMGRTGPGSDEQVMAQELEMLNQEIARVVTLQQIMQLEQQLYSIQQHRDALRLKMQRMQHQPQPPQQAAPDATAAAAHVGPGTASAATAAAAAAVQSLDTTQLQALSQQLLRVRGLACAVQPEAASSTQEDQLKLVLAALQGQHASSCPPAAEAMQQQRQVQQLPQKHQKGQEQTSQRRQSSSQQQSQQPGRVQPQQLQPQQQRQLRQQLSANVEAYLAGNQVPASMPSTRCKAMQQVGGNKGGAEQPAAIDTAGAEKQSACRVASTSKVAKTKQSKSQPLKVAAASKQPEALAGAAAAAAREEAGDADKSGPAPGEETLRTHLQELQTKEPECVLILRKINRLGFDSPYILKQHFKTYGKVERVLVAHSHVRLQGRGFTSRLRPSGLGFVVMADKAATQLILSQGENQVVGAVTIRVLPFERRCGADMLDFGDGVDERDVTDP
eukprot:TRINITY_DN615_c0_g1_i1.p1 TRINITY_DN615_c0_g1~~TRINITY_DN615_c0_g1_i1.p1  ORF type:complete len:704 (+),score=243.45 TRINITY_DN615_c0_g1_i1:160-2271(+)